MLLAVGLVGCGDEVAGEVGTNAAIYAEVLRAITTVGGKDDGPPMVFVRPVEGHEIDLAVQAAVVKQLEEQAVVRFVDEEDEVVDGDEPLEPVREDGVVVTLSTIDRVGSRAEVQAEHYVDRRDVEDRCLVLRRIDDDWRAVEEDCRRVPSS